MLRACQVVGPQSADGCCFPCALALRTTNENEDIPRHRRTSKGADRHYRIRRNHRWRPAAGTHYAAGRRAGFRQNGVRAAVSGARCAAVAAVGDIRRLRSSRSTSLPMRMVSAGSSPHSVGTRSPSWTPSRNRTSSSPVTSISVACWRRWAPRSRRLGPHACE